MRREEEPRKADCPGCHGDFTQNAAKHGNFYANSDIKKGANHPKEARLAFVSANTDVCRTFVVLSRDTNEGNNSEKLPWVQHTVAELLRPPVSHYGQLTCATAHRGICCFSLVAYKFI